jgi:hypothetical protein
VTELIHHDDILVAKKTRDNPKIRGISRGEQACGRLPHQLGKDFFELKVDIGYAGCCRGCSHSGPETLQGSSGFLYDFLIAVQAEVQIGAPYDGVAFFTGMRVGDSTSVRAAGA